MLQARSFVVAGALAANRSDGQDEVPNLRSGLEPAAFAEEENPFGLASHQQVHDDRGVGRADAEFDDA